MQNISVLNAVQVSTAIAGAEGAASAKGCVAIASICASGLGVTCLVIAIAALTGLLFWYLSLHGDSSERVGQAADASSTRGLEAGSPEKKAFDLFLEAGDAQWICVPSKNALSGMNIQKSQHVEPPSQWKKIYHVRIGQEGKAEPASDYMQQGLPILFNVQNKDRECTLSFKGSAPSLCDVDVVLFFSSSEATDIIDRLQRCFEEHNIRCTVREAQSYDDFRRHKRYWQPLGLHIQEHPAEEAVE